MAAPAAASAGQFFGYAKQHGLASLWVQTIAEVRHSAAPRLKSTQQRPTLVRAFWQQTGFAF